ncbi:hypothetical protein DL770_005246 [Monosporascus sp. CRB-9-2]|nr:hypothetical protein DL770_005246 [Monosporascus sp. CRB-9-2]
MSCDMSEETVTSFTGEEAGRGRQQGPNGSKGQKGCGRIADGRNCTPKSSTDSGSDILTPLSDAPLVELAGPGTCERGNDNGMFKGSPIAICGIGMRLPGGISSGDEFWDLLVSGRDARSKIPGDRYNVEGFDDSLGDKASIKAKFGYFLNQDLSHFDPSFFSMSKQELEKCDPQQRLLLEVTRECFEDAAETNYRGQYIGCYVGTFGDDWVQYRSKESQNPGNYSLTGSGDYTIANRVSYEYDLRGPSMVIKTACSASLVALHNACRDLEAGDATAAIVAGTNLIMGPATSAAMTSEGVLSPEGSCKTFDASADGFARADGITSLYIKRLDLALRDGNPVRAIIRGSATNSDGRSPGLLVPRAEAQEMLIRQVYADAGLDPSDTSFVECHGTGTPTGDPIETTAIGNVFGTHGVYIGSVKPNLGHGEGSAGITSVIKAVLALQHRTIPPNIKFKNPNPRIPFDEKKLTVIIDSFSPERDAIVAQDAPQPELIVFSANTQPSLERQIELYQKYALQHPDEIQKIAFTRALRRERLPHKAFAIVQPGGVIETSTVVKSVAKSSNRNIIMIFSGQGAQWAGMGAQLLTNKRFLEDITTMDKILHSLKNPPTWTIMSELQKLGEASEINKAELAQPLCTALQIALFHQFERLGITPSAVVGHSSGEIAAAYAAGYITLEFAIAAAYYRGFVVKDGSAAGAMAAIGLGANHLRDILREGVTVACENSPESTTLSGDRRGVEEAVSSIQERQPGVFARTLKVEVAYHSPYMAAAGEKYLHVLQQEHLPCAVPRGRARALFISGVTGKAIDNTNAFGPDYWVSNLISPVRFSPAVTHLLGLSGDGDLFLEIGPHSTLAGPLRQICAASNRACNYITSQTRNSDSVVSLLSAIGKLYQENVNIDFAPLFPHGRAISGLPPYPWDHSGPSFWYESRLSQAWRARKYPRHCLLGARSPESPEKEPLWRNLLHLEEVPWIADHKVGEDIVFPFAGYVAMAGEAIRQVAGTAIGSGYSLRHVKVRTALVLNDSDPVEVVTTLRQQRLTDSDDSNWFDFTITSYTGSTWVKHCEGEVIRTGVPRKPISEPKTLPHQIPAPAFYQAMKKLGFRYGPEFQGLSEIATSTTEYLAEAKLVDVHNHSASPFTLHPAAIDACLQLLVIAGAKGLLRNIDSLQVPTLIEELEISAGAAVMHACAWSEGSDVRRGRIECVADGRTVLRLRGLQLTPLNDDNGDDKLKSSDVHAAAQLRWVPDFDFVDPRTLLRAPKSDKSHTDLQQELTLLCMLEEAEKTASLTPCQPHFEKFRDWLNRQVRDAEDGRFPLVTDSARLTRLGSTERQGLIKAHLGVLENGDKRALAIATARISEHAESIFTGSREALDVLMQDNVLTELYNEDSFGYGDFVRLLSNSRPNLRILEVGAGTGGTTELILRDLVDEAGLPAYSVYTFTDVSAGFFGKAKQRFSYAHNMEYKVFDITKSPFDQGFDRKAGAYDLILAANVVHATPCIRESLANMASLLKPDGMLVLTELCGMSRAPNYPFGHLAGWWLGEGDGRPDQPYITVERWDSELKAAGLTGADVACYDHAEEAYRTNAAIISRMKTDSTPPEKNVTLLCNDENSGVARTLRTSLASAGWDVTPCRLTARPPVQQDIISCLDLEGKGFDELTEQSFKDFKTFVQSLGKEKLLWLTRPVQIKCMDPRSAQVIGVTRTLRSELALSVFTLEIYENEPEFAGLVSRVFEKIRSQEDAGNLAPDKEFAVDGGVVCIPRYHPFSLTDRLREGQTGAESVTALRKTVQVEKLGSLDTLHWQDEPLSPTIPDDHVEIETQAMGLNFRDVLLAMGVIPYDGSGSVALGFEAAGVVRRVGPAARGLAPGDRVMAFYPGSLTTHLTLPAALVLRIPDGLSFEEAATVPICFATVIHSLVSIGRLAAGQSVLIHSACGGVGLTAIQVCRMLGADMYLTVGSARKIEYLVERYGIPRSRIFNSRDASFVEGVMRETSGRGVDLVLNSLSGDLLHESWKCVAKYGAMLELGKRDIMGSGRLDMLGFQENRSYHGVDLSQFGLERPEELQKLLNVFLSHYEKGALRPLEYTGFDAGEITSAFRYMQKGDHIGKVIVTMPPADSQPTLKSTPWTRRIQFDPDSTYLLVGGVGGLGRSIATWVVERGARKLTFLSRNAGQSETSRVLFTELESMGCTVTAVAGRVDQMDDVQRAIRESKSNIKGVFQLAMVLQDTPMMDMQWSQWKEVLGPKVQGTWNLHQAFLSHRLDFFWMASSVITAIESPGQGNYVAANAFLEAFCQYRHTLGLPASVLNICPINGVGYVAENAHAQRTVKAQGIYTLDEREFLDFLDLNLQEVHSAVVDGAPRASPPAYWCNTTQVLMGLRSERQLDDPNNRTNWRRDRRMGLYHNVRAENPTSTKVKNNALLDFLALAAEEGGKVLLADRSSVEFLAREIGRKIYDFMLKPDEEVDTGISLLQIGLDSLMAIELRRWFKGVFGFNLSVLEIMGAGSLNQLAAVTATKLSEKLHGEAGS